MTMAILMLQSLTCQGCSPSGSAQQKATRLHITRRPGQITNTLESEHGVINIKRNHWQLIGTIGSCSGHPGTKSPGFIDTLFENLSIFGFAIVHNLLAVDWGIELSNG